MFNSVVVKYNEDYCRYEVVFDRADKPPSTYSSSVVYPYDPELDHARALAEVFDFYRVSVQHNAVGGLHGCRHCNGEARLDSSKSPYTTYSIRCEKCGIGTPNQNTIEDAVSIWQAMV